MRIREFLFGQGYPQTSEPPAEDEDEVLDIEDLRIPEAIRMHGACFRKPARYVTDLGNDEYILYAEDGEVLDFVRLK